jgi:hypothetical protein
MCHMCLLWCTQSRAYKSKQYSEAEVPPCGGGVEHLHRDPASRRRWRKGKSQICDSTIWSRVSRDSDPRKTALATASSIYKRQTRPLVREGAPQKQDRNYQTVINVWPSRLTYWLTVSRKLKERTETRRAEENRRSDCEEFACELEDFMCAIVQWDWECVNQWDFYSFSVEIRC